ncbi:MAG: hypothetical protein H6708_11595 [Kofleriaceae bacterium]|nr:hypothetical protein [Kofleriaceae bacterium]
MPSRPDIRDLASNVREAFADADRDALLDILTFVVKEYVVDGPPPMLMHQAETIAELANLSFAQLIAALQTRLDLPELALFAVDGDQVSVRVGGVMQPLQPGRTPAAELPRPSAGVRVVETTVAQRPAAPAVAAPAAPRPAPAPAPAPAAPPPSRGPVGARSALGRRWWRRRPGRPAAPRPRRSARARRAGAVVEQAGRRACRGAGGGDDAAARFSLLELD